MDVRFLRNVLIKAAVLFLLLNIAFTACYPLDGLGRVSIYNSLARGRERLPFGENPQETYTFSLYNLEAMLQSLALDGLPKPANEFRVLVLGDSSIWGTLLQPVETLAGQLNAANLTTCDGRAIRAYNLGYPTLSLTKDIMILEESMRYQPDLIIWSVTLQAFPKDIQLASPLVQNNPYRVRPLKEQYDLDLPVETLSEPNFWQRTLIGQRRSLADWLRLQLYAPMWSATGIDQLYPADYEPAQRDLDPDETFNNWSGPDLGFEQLSFDVLSAGFEIAGETPVLLVNEPILISAGQNSDLRYNFYYPRWAYDSYRAMLGETAGLNAWSYLDLWNLVPESQFTNSAIHLTPQGVSMMAEAVGDALNRMSCGQSAQPPAPTPTPTATPLPATATPVAVLSPTPTPTPTRPVYTDWRDYPVLPTVSDTAREIYQRGLALGNNPAAFSKVGDCETGSDWFLRTFDVQPPLYRLGEYEYLQEMILYFDGSFARRSIVAKNGFNAATALSPIWADPEVCLSGETPLACEYRIHKPSIALIAFGTNDTKNPARFEGDLRKIIEITIEAGIVPVLSTKADNLEGDNSINETIVKLAVEYDIPLWNFWAAIQDLPDAGLRADKMHLTWAQNYFDDPETMEKAWPWRNLTALQTLDIVWRGLQETP